MGAGLGIGMMDKGTFWGDGNSLIGVVVTPWCTFIETCRTLCLKYVHFIVDKLYIKGDLNIRKQEEKPLGLIVWLGKMDK